MYFILKYNIKHITDMQPKTMLDVALSVTLAQHLSGILEIILCISALEICWHFLCSAASNCWRNIRVFLFWVLRIYNLSTSTSFMFSTFLAIFTADKNSHNFDQFMFKMVSPHSWQYSSFQWTLVKKGNFEHCILIGGSRVKNISELGSIFAPILSLFTPHPSY